MNSYRSTVAWRAGMALCVILIALAAGSPARSQSPGTWTAKAPMPAVRGEVDAVVFENKLYAIGGNVAGNAVPRNEEYDPATDRWQSLPPMPNPRHGIFAGVIGNTIYLPGGGVRQGLGATNVNSAFRVSP